MGLPVLSWHSEKSIELLISYFSRISSKEDGVNRIKCSNSRAGETKAGVSRARISNNGAPGTNRTGTNGISGINSNGVSFVSLKLWMCEIVLQLWDRVAILVGTEWPRYLLRECYWSLLHYSSTHSRLQIEWVHEMPPHNFFFVSRLGIKPRTSCVKSKCDTHKLWMHELRSWTEWSY